jgi:DNA (cytosine-5)-methyltransferase 1
MSAKPRLLDLFCGAGGASVGYSRAGFEVVGVDIKPQPRYPFEFVQADALDFLRSKKWAVDTALETWDQWDAIHASPPCQFATAYKRTGNVKDSPNLIHEARELLDATGLPWVIENVEQASPWMFGYTMLCGSMFDPPMEIQRHRLFETSYHWELQPPQWPCRHKLNGKDRYPGGRSKSRTGSSRGLVRATMEIGSWDIPLSVQQEAMDIDWMTLEELSQAIPPAYTEFIGTQLMQYVREPVRTLSGVRE